MAGIEVMEEIGRNRYGVFPVRGNMLNVRGLSILQISKNEEIMNIMKILGLDFHKKFEDNIDWKSLKYG